MHIFLIGKFKFYPLDLKALYTKIHKMEFDKLPLCFFIYLFIYCLFILFVCFFIHLLFIYFISMFFVEAIDAKRCWATGRGIQPKGVRVNENAEFKIHTEGGDGEPRVLILGPGGVNEKCAIKRVESVFECVY